MQKAALTEVTFFVLLSLYEKNHGYGIMQFIKSTTNGRLVLGAGSFYGALESLIAKKWIVPINDGEARRKEYVITETGKAVVNSEIKRLKDIANIATKIVGGKI